MVTPLCFDINVPGVHTLLDGRSGDPITTIEILPAKPGAGIPLGGPNCGGPYTGPCIAHEGRTPQPAFTDDPEPGMAIAQSADSFTSDVKITVDVCWDHSSKVHIKISGGLAAKASTGSDYTFNERECTGFISQGQPFGYRRQMTFQRDVFEDNSYRIYAIGTGKFYRYAPEPGFDIPPERTAVLEISSLGQNVTRTWHERGAGGVFWGGAIDVFGTGLDVSTGSTDGSEATVKMEFAAGPAGETRRYTIYIASGTPSDSTGIIAAAWSGE